MRLPTSWSEITVRQFLKLDEILRDTHCEPLDKELLILVALTGKSKDYFEEMNLGELKDLMRSVRFLSDISTIRTEFPRWIWFKGKLYRPIQDVSKLTGAQYIDISTFCKDQKQIMQQIHNVLAVLIIPVKWGLFRRKYNGELQRQSAERFMDLPMHIAYPIALFFCQVWAKLQDAILEYLSEETKELMKTLKSHSNNTTVG